MYVDLNPDGLDLIPIGELVEVEFRLNAHAGAKLPCEYGEFGITLWLDDFAFCDWAPNDHDLTGDGIVNAADLAVLLGNWGPCLGGCYGDFVVDGVVGPADLAVLLGNWD